MACDLQLKNYNDNFFLQVFVSRTKINLVPGLGVPVNQQKEKNIHPRDNVPGVFYFMRCLS